ALGAAFLPEPLPGDREGGRDRATPAMVAVAVLGVAACTVANVRRLSSEPPAPRVDEPRTRDLSVAAADALRSRPRGRTQMRILSAATWPTASGVALALEKTGVELSVDDRWLFMFGRAFRATSPPETELLFTDAELARELRSRPDVRFLAESGGVSLFER